MDRTQTKTHSTWSKLLYNPVTISLTRQDEFCIWNLLSLIYLAEKMQKESTYRQHVLVESAQQIIESLRKLK